MENEYVCRTCLQIFTSNSVSHLNSTEDDSDSISLGQKLQACVPELAVDIVYDPVICEICRAALVLTYQFKSSCLKNQQTLFNFIEQRKQNPCSGLLTISDLLQIVRKGINEEQSSSITEKCYSNGHISNSGSDSESLKLPTAIPTSLKDLVKQALVDCSDFVDTEDKEEISKATTKAKVKNKRIKPSVENGVCNEEVAKSSTTSVTSHKNGDESQEVSTSRTNTSSKTMSTNTRHSMTTRESASSSAKSDHKQAIKTKRGQLKKEDTFSNSQPVENTVDSLEESGIPNDTHNNKVTHKKRKRNTYKGNLRDRTNNKSSKESAKSLSKNIKTTRNTKANMKKDNKQNMANERSLAHDEATAKRQREIFKKQIYLDQKTASKKITKQISTTPERQNDSKINRNEILSSPRPIKKRLSDRDIRITNQDALDNDLLEINQPILKNDLSELPNRRDAKGYHCTECDKYYNLKAHFDAHLQSHIFKKLYTMRQGELATRRTCNKDFAHETYLKSHRTFHTSTGLYQCDVCEKYLSGSTALKRHYRTHTGEKPYPCARCNKRFTQKSHLLAHIRVHTGKKPYKCDQCPRRFRQRRSLQKHQHLHSVKPFWCRDFLNHCNVCNRGFTTKFNMKRHMKVHVRDSTESCM